MKKLYITLLTLFSLAMTVACGKNDENPGGGEQQPLPMLDIENLREAPVVMGMAVSVKQLKEDEKYRNLVVEHCNSITAENAMKMPILSKGIGLYDWSDADYVVTFAQENSMRVHGHTLLWYKNTPSWFTSFNGTKEEWIALMKQYVVDVVTHFKGKVASWDVVNEVVADDGTMRPSIWLTKIGTEYIDLAFQFAHEADPDALLFYNEYGQEYSHLKEVAINKLVDGLIQRSVPIHGVGMQMHTDINKQESRIQYSIRAIASRGLKVHISELDVSVNPDNDAEAEYTDELKLKQQNVYRWTARAMTQVAEASRFGITLWGVSDQYSWRYASPDWVLPFGADYARKSAYDGLLQGFYTE